VPIDGVGPPLLSATETEEFSTVPTGYRPVEFIGTPQETRSGGAFTNHAQDGVERALGEATSHSSLVEVWFNRAVTTSTRGEVVLPLRPDVMAVYRYPEDVLRFKPIESYSPGQDPNSRATELQHPRLERPEGDFYRKLLWLLWKLGRKSS
jgi:hypothetical protein